MRTRAKQRELTGRTVLVLVVAFFGTVAAVNGLMIHYALSTFRGEVADHPYEAGLAFNHEIAASRAQDARSWTVEVRLPRKGDRRFEASLRDSSGAPIDGVKVTAIFAAPVDARLDRSVDLTESAAGLYRGEIPVRPGYWDLEIVSKKDGETLFQSRNRIEVE